VQIWCNFDSFSIVIQITLKVPIEWCKANKIRVGRVPSYSPSSIAEYALSSMFALAKNIQKSYELTKEADFTIGGLQVGKVKNLLWILVTPRMIFTSLWFIPPERSKGEGRKIIMAHGKMRWRPMCPSVTSNSSYTFGPRMLKLVYKLRKLTSKLCSELG